MIGPDLSVRTEILQSKKIPVEAFCEFIKKTVKDAVEVEADLQWREGRALQGVVPSAEFDEIYKPCDLNKLRLAIKFDDNSIFEVDLLGKIQFVRARTGKALERLRDMHWAYDDLPARRSLTKRRQYALYSLISALVILNFSLGLYLVANSVRSKELAMGAAAPAIWIPTLVGAAYALMAVRKGSSEQTVVIRSGASWSSRPDVQARAQIAASAAGVVAALAAVVAVLLSL